MTATTIRVQMAQRKDTAANWTAANPILLSGEIGYETNTKKFKIGDGSTAWNSLAYLPIPDGSGNLTITGNLEIGSTGSLTFEGSTADGFETTLAVTNPTADRTITLPNQSGTVLVSGNASIVDADIAANAEIAVSKLADGAARQLLQTDAAGTGVEWTSNIDVPGTLDVTNTATFDSIAQYPAGSAAAPTITFTGDTNTGLFSPGSDQLALATGGTQRLLIDASGNVISAGNLYANGTNGVVLFSADPANYSISRSGGDLTFKGGANISVSAGGGTSSLLLSNSPYAAFNVGGSERLRLDSSGRLGLGTSSPGAKAEIVSSGSESSLILRNTDQTPSTYSELKFAPFTGTTAAAASIRSEYYGNNGSSLAFRTTNIASEPVTRLFIDSEGDVGIGTTSPSRPLHVSSSGSEQVILSSTSGSLAGIFFEPNGTTYTPFFGATGNSLVSYTQGLERARIDSSGRLLVGTSSARNNFFGAAPGVAPQLQLEGGDTAASTLSITRNSNDADGPTLAFGRSRSTTNTVVQSGDRIGRIEFQGNDATSFVRSAVIEAFVDGTPGTNDMPGRLVFSTTADGASSPTERMRIASDGFTNLFVTANDGFQSRNSAAAGTTYGFFVGRHSAANTGDGTISYVVYTNGNVQNTNNSYGAISDIKLKENIVDANSQWNDLKALQVRNYNFKEGQTHTQIGLVAQEVELVSPGLVTESPDRDEEGNDLGTVTKSVNYSVLYMKAVKALQEAMERIETLEAKVAALEAV